MNPNHVDQDEDPLRYPPKEKLFAAMDAYLHSGLTLPELVLEAEEIEDYEMVRCLELIREDQEITSVRPSQWYRWAGKRERERSEQ